MSARAALRDARGVATVVVALSLAALIGGAALAVDIGSFYLASRRLQGIADDAALAAAIAIGDPAGAATRTIRANGIDAMVTAAATGHYSADATIASASRFAPGGTAPDAARITIAQDVPLFFARAFATRSSLRLSASATAARIDYAAFSIGSRLASAGGGVPGALLSALAGSDLGLSAGDYGALAAADVDLLPFASALGTRAGIGAGGYGDALSATVTLPQAIGAIADALAAAGGNSAAIAALRTAALRVPGRSVRLADIVDPGVLSAADHGDATHPIRVGADALLRETLGLSAGGRQVAIDLPAPGGIASARLLVAIGQRAASSPWLAVARDGSVVVRTAQMRLYLDVTLGGAAALGLVSLRLPLYIELAQAQAKLAAISCAGGPGNATVTLSVQPAIGSAAVADIDAGTLNAFSSALTEKPATLAHALLFDVTGKAHVAFGGATWQSVAFGRADIDAGTMRTVSTNDAARGIAASLVSGMTLAASAAGIGVPLAGVTAPVGTALQAGAPAIDAMLSQILATLGIGLGQADVRVDGVRCGRPILVY